MINVNFNGYANYQVDNLTQWDTNQEIRVTGLTFSGTPTVLFSNRLAITAEPVNASYSGGVLTATIPNGLLTEAYPVYAYVRVKSGSTYTVVAKIRIPVERATKPDDYVYIENISVATYADVMAKLDEIENNEVRTSVLRETVKQYIDDGIADGSIDALFLADGSIGLNKLSSEVVDAIEEASKSGGDFVRNDAKKIDLKKFTTVNNGTSAKVTVPITELKEKFGNTYGDGLILRFLPNGSANYSFMFVVYKPDGTKKITLPNNEIYFQATDTTPRLISFPEDAGSIEIRVKKVGANFENNEEIYGVLDVSIVNPLLIGDIPIIGSDYKSLVCIKTDCSSAFSAKMLLIPFEGRLIIDNIPRGGISREFGNNSVLSQVKVYNGNPNRNIDPNAMAYIKDNKDYGKVNVIAMDIIDNDPEITFIAVEYTDWIQDAIFYKDRRPAEDSSLPKVVIDYLINSRPELKRYCGKYDINLDSRKYVIGSSLSQPPIIGGNNGDYYLKENAIAGDFWIYEEYSPKMFKTKIAEYGDVIYFDGTAMLCLENPLKYGPTLNSPEDQYDVCIVGGGAGGIGTAYALRASGLKVVLCEKLSSLGGTHVHGGIVCQIANPIGDWYKPVVEEGVSYGAMIFEDSNRIVHSIDYAENESDFDKKWNASLYQRGTGSTVKSVNNHITVNPYYLHRRYHKDLSDDIEIRYNREFIRHNEADGTVVSATFRNLVTGGEETIYAKYFVDATADAYLTRYGKTLDQDYYIGTDPFSMYNESGASAISKGNHYEINTMELPYIYSSYGTNVAHGCEPFNADDPYAEDKTKIPVLPDVSRGQNSAYNYTYFTDYSEWKPNYSYFPPYCIQVSPGLYEGITPQQFIDYGYDATYSLARKRALAHYGIYKSTASTYFIGCRKMLGIRESYRVNCERMLTQADVEATVTAESIVSDHVVALSTWYVDLHGSSSVNKNGIANSWYNGIPYECMIPKSYKNVLVACRAYGASHIALSAIRLTKTMLSLGYASGKALIQCVNGNIDDVRNVNIATLQSDIDIMNIHNKVSTLIANTPI